MNAQQKQAIHHELLKRKIALEQASEMFDDKPDIVKMQIFHPKGKSKLIRIPGVSAYVAIESALRQVKKQLLEFERDVLNLQ